MPGSAVAPSIWPPATIEPLACKHEVDIRGAVMRFRNDGHAGLALHQFEEMRRRRQQDPLALLGLERSGRPVSDQRIVGRCDRVVSDSKRERQDSAQTPNTHADLTLPAGEIGRRAVWADSMGVRSLRS